jgi:hypothetical protein
MEIASFLSISTSQCFADNNRVPWFRGSGSPTDLPCARLSASACRLCEGVGGNTLKLRSPRKPHRFAKIFSVLAQDNGNRSRSARLCPPPSSRRSALASWLRDGGIAAIASGKSVKGMVLLSHHRGPPQPFARKIDIDQFRATFRERAGTDSPPAARAARSGRRTRC